MTLDHLTPAHPVLGIRLPPRTAPVPAEVRDWSPESHARAWRRLVALTLASYGTTCHLCGRPGATSADHLIPRAHGGLNAIANLRPAHQTCNYARQDATLIEWFRTHPVRRSAAPSRDW